MRHTSHSGFTLVEVLVAMLIVVAIATSVARLTAVALLQARGARDALHATMIAAQKIEQARASVAGLAWGTGSPAGALDASLPGFADYLDAAGVRLGGAGSAVPPGAVYVRRWSLTALPVAPASAAVLRVFVTTVARDASRAAGGGSWPRHPSDVLLVTIIARRSA